MQPVRGSAATQTQVVSRHRWGGGWDGALNLEAILPPSGSFWFTNLMAFTANYAVANDSDKSTQCLQST